MKRIFLAVVAMVITASAMAQHVIYDENAELRTGGSINSIEVSGTISLYLTQSSQTAVAVSAGDEKYNSKIKTEIKGGVLKISVDGGVWNGFSWTNRKLKAYVSAPDIKRLEVSGASFVQLMETLTLNDLSLSISGASELKGNIKVKSLHAELSGASVVKLTGDGETAAIEASGAAKFQGIDFKTDNAKIDASGASNISITANKVFTANASGGSSVRYSGNATAEAINASAGASIRKRSGND